VKREQVQSRLKPPGHIALSAKLRLNCARLRGRHAFFRAPINAAPP